MEVEGLMQGKEIVPLTEVYVELQVKRFLLKETFYDLLIKEANILLAFANAQTPDAQSTFGNEYLAVNKKF
jgi:hypothetical protein